ncbi:MAG: YebC/PmpR family DNA-binding transcriptional regulator [Raineya sp.]|jgi:YebC/PmpR family DNA-binding regulatory protein|nr:YebC/PmpR family DNA-binding transcriptional regulator [Raineya sp.]
MGRAFEFRKGRKMKRWGQMAKTFTKYAREIAMAVKAGGAEPEYNSRLRAILQNAKQDNVPKDNIERAIKKASSKDQEDYKELVYEGYGPHGIAVVIETATDNPTRTVANIRSYFNKTGGSLGTTGSLDFLFERQSIFQVTKKASVDLEELEFELIDFGLNEMASEEDDIFIYGTFEAFGKIQKYLEDNAYEIKSAKLERIPHDTKELTSEQEADVEKLLEKLEDDEDVQQVFHNMK